MVSKKKQKSASDLASINLVGITNNIEDESVKYTVEFSVGDIIKTVTTTFENLYNDLSRNGYNMCRYDEREVKAMISEQMVEGTVVMYTYKGLGWHTRNDSLVWKGSNLIPDNLYGEYEGAFDIKPHGTIENLSLDLLNLIIGHLTLEFSIISGLSAATSGLLKRLGQDISTTVLNIYGDSSTGKSTCARLAVSVGCNVFTDGNKASLSTDCNTTTTAMTAMLDNNYGYPILFDELGELDDRVNLRPLLYSIANGSDKSRCDSTGELAKKRNWQTVVIFTGEHSILDLTPNTSGILVRVLNLPNVKWTDSANQVKQINRFCRKYSGLPLDAYARKLYKVDAKDFVKRFESYTEEFSEKIVLEGGYRDRMAKVAAIYKLTAEIAGETFGVTFDTEGITDFVVEHINQTQAKLEKTDLYDQFMQYVFSNANQFLTEVPSDFCLHSNPCGTLHDVKHPTGKVLGYIKYDFCAADDKSAHYIIILKEKFREWFERTHGKGEGINKTLKEWHKKGLIVTAKDGRYVTTIPKTDPYVSMLQVTDSGSGVSCYKILCNFRKDYVLTEERPDPKPLTRRKVLEEDEEVTDEETVSDDDQPPPSLLKGGEEHCTVHNR